MTGASTPAARDGAQAPKKRRRRLLTDLILFAAVLALALAARAFLFEVAVVKGNSMRSTLQNGEVMLVSTLDYRLGDPQRHDVVICHYPGRQMKNLPFLQQQFVKRVVGLPGDTIEIIDSVIYVNGEALREDYLDPAHTRFRTNRPPITLGEDEYYVLGDNRDNSNDSRSIGPIKRGMIVGHVRRVLYPFRSARRVGG